MFAGAYDLLMVCVVDWKLLHSILRVDIGLQHMQIGVVYIVYASIGGNGLLHGCSCGFTDFQLVLVCFLTTRVLFCRVWYMQRSTILYIYICCCVLVYATVVSYVYTYIYICDFMFSFLLRSGRYNRFSYVWCLCGCHSFSLVSIRSFPSWALQERERRCSIFRPCSQWYDRGKEFSQSWYKCSPWWFA